jgi:hypothetical protein
MRGVKLFKNTCKIPLCWCGGAAKYRFAGVCGQSWGGGGWMEVKLFKNTRKLPLCQCYLGRGGSDGGGVSKNRRCSTCVCVCVCVCVCSGVGVVREGLPGK